MAEIISKTEYAHRLGVNPAAVSNYIRRRKLTPPALTADGRINVQLANRQLGAGAVDPVLSGAATRRSAGAPAKPQSDDDCAAWSPSAQVNLQRARATALSATIDAERKRRQLNFERGRYMLTVQAEAEWGKALSDFLLEVEQSFADLNYQLAGLDDRERLLAIRRWWRKLRGGAAAANRDAAGLQPEFVEDTAR